MGMAAILFNGAEPFKQKLSTSPSSTDGPMKNLKKMGKALSENLTFKEFMILPGAGADNSPKF